jgi:hypothetical protein
MTVLGHRQAGRRGGDVTLFLRTITGNRHANLAKGLMIR